MTDRFPTESTFQGDLSKELFPLISLFQLYLHLKTLYQISVRNTHVAEWTNVSTECERSSVVAVPQGWTSVFSTVSLIVQLKS